MQEEDEQPKPLPKKQYLLVSEMIDYWQRVGALDADSAEALKSSIVRARFDWRGLAKYSLLIAVCGLVIGGIAALVDRAIVTFLDRFLAN